MGIVSLDDAVKYGVGAKWVDQALDEEITLGKHTETYKETWGKTQSKSKDRPKIIDTYASKLSVGGLYLDSTTWQKATPQSKWQDARFIIDQGTKCNNASASVSASVEGAWKNAWNNAKTINFSQSDSISASSSNTTNVTLDLSNAELNNGELTLKITEMEDGKQKEVTLIPGNVYKASISWTTFQVENVVSGEYKVSDHVGPTKDNQGNSISDKIGTVLKCAGDYGWDDNDVIQSLNHDGTAIKDLRICRNSK